MACQPRDGDRYVTPDVQAPRPPPPRRRACELSAAELRRERDIRMWELVRVSGWGLFDLEVLTGLTAKAIRKRLAMMASAAEEMRRDADR